MKDNSSICEQGQAQAVDITSIEDDLFAGFTEGENALNRLLFVGSLLSVRIFI